jgi:CheY-like chemotaxis protein
VPHTLLLADDSVTIQRVIELTFAEEDIKVVAVSDGDQAIERLDAAPPDIVLADIGMPGKNGYEVAQYVRHTPKLSHIPVVLLTGAFEPVDQARASEAGCDDVLAKPFEPQLVIGRVKELLARGHHAAAASETAASSPIAAAPPPPAPSPAPPPAPSPAAPSAATPADVALDDYFDRLDAAFSSLTAAPAAPATATSSPLSADVDWFGAAPADGAPAELWDLPALNAASPTAASSDVALSYGSPGADFAPPAGQAPDAVPSDLASIVVDHQPAATAVAEPAAPSEPPAPAQKEAPLPAHAAASAPIAAGPAAPPAAIDAPDMAWAGAPPSSATPVPGVPAVSLPTLGDAFAALLAAEQNDASASGVAWPGIAPTAAPGSAPAAPDAPAAATPAPAAPPAPEITDAMIDDVVRRVLDRMSDGVVRETTSRLVSETAERLVREEIERIKSAMK